MPQREFNSNTAEEIALLDAAKIGDLNTMRHLLSQGLDPNTPDMREDPWNVTPLMHAAANGHWEIIQELLRAKAKVNLADKSVPGEGGGETALHYAARARHLSAAKLLLSSCADVNKVSRYGETPLTLAVGEQQIEMAQFFLRSGAKPDLTSKYTGRTPLHVAAFEGSFELVKILVGYAADINAKDQAGSTPFMDATVEPHPEISAFLLKHDVDLEAADANGITCLMWAVMSKDAKLVTEVLKHGVNLNVLDSEGKSALDFAIRDELPEIQALLRKAGAKTGAELRPSKKTAGRKRR